MRSSFSAIRLSLLALGLMAGLVASQAQADYVPVLNFGETSASGSLIEPDQLTTVGNWLDTQPFSVEWAVSYNAGTNQYTYTYVVSGYRQPDVSHFNIAVSDGENGSTIFGSGNVISAQMNGSDVDWELNDRAEPNNPSDYYYLKFDEGREAPTTYTLVSDRAPIYGSFFAKGGNDSYAYSNGWADQGSALLLSTTMNPDLADWLAVPDTYSGPPPGPVVPEPSTILGALFSLLPIGLIAYRRRRTA